jgi:regulatory protein YycH of two-component signal transduction system YycFG
MNKSFVIKLIFLCLVIISITLTYYLKIVAKDYDIHTNEDGLPILEE